MADVVEGVAVEVLDEELALDVVTEGVVLLVAVLEVDAEPFTLLLLLTLVADTVFVEELDELTLELELIEVEV